MNNSHSTYFCPMHPEITSSHSGSCSVCGISLEPLIPTRKEDHNLQALKYRAIFAILLTTLETFIHLSPLKVEQIISAKSLGLVEFILTTLVVFIAGYPLIKKGVLSFISLRLNRFSLIAFAILAAYTYSLVKIFAPYFSSSASFPLLSSLYFEPSAVITTLVLIGQWIEIKAIQKINEPLKNFICLKPQIAHLIINGQEMRKIAIEDVRKGDHLHVNPREQIPVDGTVSDGSSWVNESAITGEPIPVFKRVKSPLLAGTINGNNTLTMEAKTTSEETLLSSMIQRAAAAKYTLSPIQKRVDAMVIKLIPIVFLIACISLLMWILTGHSFEIGLSHAIAVLIIACPSALMLATPISMNVGMNLGASQGILIKETASLEEMEKVNLLIIDKTGVLTEGKPMLTKISARFPFSETEVLKFGASVEQFSNHPLAEPIVMGAKLKQIPLIKAVNFQTIEGKGVIAEVDGSRVIVGNAQLLNDLSVDPASLIKEALEWQKEGLTVLFIALEYRAIGLIAVADPIKFTAERAIQQLHREKVRIVMATGDSEEAAMAVAKKLHIDEVFACALPQDKMALVQKFQKKGFIVAMAGDGINDFSALSESDVGIIMRNNSDSTLYDSSITLMKGDLCGVVRARLLSKITMQNVKENLFLAIIYNIIAIPLAAGAFYYFIPHFSLSPLIASIAMAPSALLVIMNAMRLYKRVIYD